MISISANLISRSSKNRQTCSLLNSKLSQLIQHICWLIISQTISQWPFHICVDELDVSNDTDISKDPPGKVKMIYLCLSTAAALRLSPVGVVQKNLAQLQQLDCGLDFPPAPPVQKWSRARTAARAPGAKKTAGFACTQTRCQTDPHPGDLIKCQATGAYGETFIYFA